MKPMSADTISKRVTYFEKSFLVADETSGVTKKLVELLQQVEVGGKKIHDANVVATMLVIGVNNLLTLNTKDFERYRGVINLLTVE